MELHQIDYFLAVADCGSFTRAAEKCLVAQPSLSQQIAKLERELGASLFDRLGRTVRLTEAGERFRDRVAPVARLLADAKADLADSGGRAGRLIVGAIPTMASALLPAMLDRFLAEDPAAHVEVIEEPTAGLMRGLADASIDLALVSTPLPASGDRELEVLGSEELLAVVPAGHRLAAKAKVRAEDLRGEPFLALHDVHCLGGAASMFCAARNVAPVVTARLHQISTILELVALGRGVSLVPASSAKGDADARRVFRPLARPGPSREVALAWDRRRYQTRLAARFREAARVAFGA